jgi:hypothetical protein
MTPVLPEFAIARADGATLHILARQASARIAIREIENIPADIVVREVARGLHALARARKSP